MAQNLQQKPGYYITGAVYSYSHSTTSKAQCLNQVCENTL